MLCFGTKREYKAGPKQQEIFSDNYKVLITKSFDLWFAEKRDNQKEEIWRHKEEGKREGKKEPN